MQDEQPTANRGDDLREQAQRRLPAACAESGSVPPEEAQRMLHELRVHQIELQMQNEELRRAQAELEASRARYFDLHDLAPVGYLTIQEEGPILEANLTVARLLGVQRSVLIQQPLTRFVVTDDQDAYYLHCKRLWETRAPQACEVRLLRPDGSWFWARLEASLAQHVVRGATAYLVVVSDITERKRAEEERELELRLLNACNAALSLQEILRDVTWLVQNWSGCEAVGIRLRDGEDFPYYQTRGFPPRFVLADFGLCEQDSPGPNLGDHAGHPLLQCMCGNVLAGRFDAALPCFTPHGSFWTNSASQLPATATPGDSQTRTRNRCHQAGYESVALLPLRAGGTILGLLQLNDKRPGRFTAGSIALLERLVDSVARAIAQCAAQEDLRESEARYRLLADNTSDVLWILNPQTGRFTYVSPSVERLRGYSAEEVCAQPLEQALTAESYAYAQARLAERLPLFVHGAGGTDVYLDDLEQVCKDGSTVWTEVVTRYVRNERGEIQLLGVSRDITARRWAQTLRLRDRAINASTEGICITGSNAADNPLVYVNHGFELLTGYSAQEVLGQNMRLLQGPDTDMAAVRRMRAAIRAEQAHATDVLNYRKDGTPFWNHISLTPVQDSSGAVSHFVAVLRDITRQKADQNRLASMDLQLRHAARLATMGELAAGIAHELNQPLCSIVNFAKACRNLALQSSPDLLKIGQWSEAIAGAAARSGDMIRRLCGFARQSEVVFSSVSLRQLVDDAVMLVRFEAETQTIALRNDVRDGDLTVKVHPVQIHQVLVNLLRNAIEAFAGGRPAAEEVTVSASEIIDGVEICVHDNGPGLPGMDREALFAPFFTTKPEGLGLGLAISKTIVEAHGGRIWATANSDRGATLHFTLPLRKDEAHDARQENGVCR